MVAVAFDGVALQLVAGLDLELQNLLAADGQFIVRVHGGPFRIHRRVGVGLLRRQQTGRQKKGDFQRSVSSCSVSTRAGHYMHILCVCVHE